MTPPGFFALFPRFILTHPLFLRSPGALKVMSITCPSRLAMLLNFVNSLAVIKLAAAICSDTSWLFRSLSKIQSDSPLVFAQPRSFKSHVHYLARPSRLAMLLSYVNSFAVINLAAAVSSDTSWLLRSLSPTFILTHPLFLHSPGALKVMSITWLALVDWPCF